MFLQNEPNLLPALDGKTIELRLSQRIMLVDTNKTL
jgi:hypothetical protein